MNHVIQIGDLLVSVGNDRETDHGCSGFSSISLIHCLCDSAASTDSANAFTLRLSNSGFSLAVNPSSVVHTGVKSAGWENNTTQESPAHS